MLLTLILAACTIPEDRTEPDVAAILAREQAPLALLDRLAGTWRLVPSDPTLDALRGGTGDVGAWLAANPAHPAADAARAALAELDATRLVVVGSTLELRRPAGTFRATVTVDAQLREARRDVLGLQVHEESGRDSRLDVTWVGVDTIEVAHRGVDEPPTRWVREGAQAPP